MPPISNIQKKYKRYELVNYLRVASVLLLMLLISYLSLRSDAASGEYSTIISISSFFVVIIVIFSPKMSKDELIRYRLAELLESVNGKSIKKSVYHLNMLAYNLEKFENELGNSFILNTSKNTLKDFRELLKYRIYPSLTDDDVHNIIIDVKDIYTAVDNGDLVRLNKTLEESKAGEIDTDILLPYEKPPILNRIAKYIQNTFTTSFQKNFAFKFFCIAASCLFMGYLISTITTLKFDTTLVGALLIVAMGIAKEYK